MLGCAGSAALAAVTASGKVCTSNRRPPRYANPNRSPARCSPGPVVSCSTHDRIVETFQVPIEAAECYEAEFFPTFFRPVGADPVRRSSRHQRQDRSMENGLVAD